jgi:hypothetical protein
VGGKTKTYRDVSAQHIFDPTDDLFKKDLLRQYAVYGAIYPYEFMVSLLDSSGKYTNIHFLKAMGVIVEAEATVKAVTLNEVKEYVDDTYPHTINIPLYFADKDLSGTSVILDALRLKQWLESLYTADTTFIRTFSYQHSSMYQQQI